MQTQTISRQIQLYSILTPRIINMSAGLMLEVTDRIRDAAKELNDSRFARYSNQEINEIALEELKALSATLLADREKKGGSQGVTDYDSHGVVFYFTGYQRDATSMNCATEAQLCLRQRRRENRLNNESALRHEA